jgi:GntR family transcriptional regulator
MTITKYRQLAADLREDIRIGRYPPGTTLPTYLEMAAERGVSKTTVSTALEILEAEGLVRPVRKRGTVVLDQRAVRVEYSRYIAALDPDTQLGPWEIACARQGINGEMRVIETEHGPADAEVAAALGIPEGTEVVRRSRHAVIGNGTAQVVQIHTAWYPAWMVEGTPISGERKVTGGIYAALAAAGHLPVTASETVTSREATDEETAELHMRSGAVLVVERVTRDGAGRGLEWLRIVADPARTVLVYDDLPLSRSR